MAVNPKASEKDVLTRLKQIIEQTRLMKKIPRDIQNLFNTNGDPPWS